MNNLFLFSVMMLLAYSSMSQDLAHYRWKNRLLIIQADQAHQHTLQKQLLMLDDKKGLAERKLVIISMSPEYYTIRDFAHSDDQHTERKTLIPGHELSRSFEIKLVGLDGGIKLEKESTITQDELFSIIDGMPMRRAELRRIKRSNN